MILLLAVEMEMVWVKFLDRTYVRFDFIELNQFSIGNPVRKMQTRSLLSSTFSFPPLLPSNDAIFSTSPILFFIMSPDVYCNNMHNILWQLLLVWCFSFLVVIASAVCYFSRRWFICERANKFVSFVVVVVSISTAKCLLVAERTNEKIYTKYSICYGQKKSNHERFIHTNILMHELYIEQKNKNKPYVRHFKYKSSMYKWICAKIFQNFFVSLWQTEYCMVTSLE